MMTVRSFSLGRLGEAQWERLRAAYVLSQQSGEIVLVASDSRNVRDEIRRRLEAMAPRVEVIEPSNGVTLAIHSLAKRRADGEKLPVAWIEAPASSPSPESDMRWIEALVVLNQTRDALQMHGPCHVVLAGPRALHRVVATRAPDLASFMRVMLLLEDTLENLVTQQGTLTWLHLSDLHVRSESWQQDQVLEALVRDLPKLLEERELRPDLLFVTGDVAARGQREEYDGAFIVLDEIAKTLGLDRRQHVFVVPGNHDVDRAKIGRMAKGYHASLLNLGPDELRGAVSELLGDAREFALYGERLGEWCSFTEKLLGRARSVSPERPWRSDVVDVRGLPVGVLSLCTSWASGPDDRKGSLILGERQLHEMVAEVRDGGAQLVIALMHHPLHWLHDGEYSAIRGRLERDTDVVLHGHVHDAHAALQVAAGAAHAEIGAGAAYAGLGQDAYHGFSVGRLEVDRGRLDVHGFTWSTRSGRWHADSGAPGADDRGRVSFAFSPAAIAPEVARSGGHEVLATRLRHAAAKVYATHDFAGLGVLGPRKHVTVDQIFVPPRFQSDAMGGIDMGEDWDGAEEGEEMFPGRGEKDVDWLEMLLTDGRHSVVLGDPGSGKSTLCKHIAVAAARREAGPVPVLLTVRDWLAEGRREGLLEMAAREATQRLAVHTDAAALERLCEHEKVWLMVDGIDEAADPAVRRDLRDRVHGLVSSLPNVTVMATSRFAGYSDIPLDHRFNELSILPFDDHELEQFVHHWYDLIENDPSERLRKRVDLLHALEVEPRTKELARNPLLATLIGMVHFSHAQLPGDRAKLYGMMIELLLVTWPAERGRQLAELHGTAQQPMLEELALRLQEQRAGTEGAVAKAEVLIDLERLESMLTDLLIERVPERSASEQRYLARKWSKWLLDDSGLMQEHQPGRVGFLHLSLMEYMAGRALLEHNLESGYDGVAELVAARHDQPVWRETLLLMLGSESKKRELGLTVIERLLTREPKQPLAWTTCVFALALLREEIDVGATRDSLLECSCETAVEVSPWEWREACGLLSDTLRFGRTHGEAVRAWLREHIGGESGVRLSGAVAMAIGALPDEEVVTLLSTRTDRKAAVLELLDFGPNHPIGRWARRHATGVEMLTWAQSTPLEAVVWRSFEGMLQGNGAAWIPELLSRPHWMAQLIRSNTPPAAQFDGDEPLQGGPRKLSWFIDDTLVGVARLDSAMAQARPQISSKSLPLEFIYNFAWDFSLSFAMGFVMPFARELAEGVALPETREFAESFGQYFAMHFPRNAAYNSFRSPKTIDGYLSPIHVQSFAQRFARYFGLDDTVSQFRVRVDSNPAATLNASSVWHLLCNAKTEDEARPLIIRLFVTMLAELHAGLVVAHLSQDRRHTDTAITIRTQDRWLNLLFTPLVEHATRTRPLATHPELHALLLTYGLIQYQTTWEWPDCPHWRSWFAADPPTHWLPAHVFHLVRSIQDPSDPTHRQQADAALDRNDWPELAQALRETTLVPTPPEVLALFDHGTPSDDPKPPQ